MPRDGHASVSVMLSTACVRGSGLDPPPGLGQEQHRSGRPPVSVQGVLPPASMSSPIVTWGLVGVRCAVSFSPLEFFV